DLNYTYDGTGNVLTLNTETYRYDWLNRLNYSSGPWTTITYAFDQVGNRAKMMQGSTTTYTYGAFNRLSSAGSTSYTYDANGNTITKSGGWVFSYDYENRLTKVVQSSTTVQTNSYDGGGNRIKQVAGSNTFTYSYQGLNILYEKNVTGGTTTVTKHFFAGSLQVAKMVGSTAYYLHQDALGSTRLVATSTVTIKFSSNYVPYGNNYAVSGKEVFMYTGKPQDSATGLYYFGARYYDPTTGRFVTQDSYAGHMNDPMSLNRYIYARDNPERYVDPTGQMYAGRYWTDSDDPSFLATLVQETAPGGQKIYVTPGTKIKWTKQPEDFATWFTQSYVTNPTFIKDVTSTVIDAATIAIPELKFEEHPIVNALLHSWTSGTVVLDLKDLGSSIAKGRCDWCGPSNNVIVGNSS
ncbi:MAG TPA: RHS repeat-associated core domain-containing protein, partial [Nitrososphaerales archaeon]|nr:RHS repeat-associated core domain-containing protein [Nitrososphaerales archaeon]